MKKIILMIILFAILICPCVNKISEVEIYSNNEPKRPYEVQQLDVFLYINENSPNVFVVYNLSYIFYSGEYYKLELIIDWDNFDGITNISITDSLGVIYEENINRFPGTFYVEQNFGRIKIIWFFESFIVGEDTPVVLNFSIAFVILNLLNEANGKNIIDYSIISEDFELTIYNAHAYIYLPPILNLSEITYTVDGDASFEKSEDFIILKVATAKIGKESGWHIRVETPKFQDTPITLRLFVNENSIIISLLVFLIVDGCAGILWIIRGRDPKVAVKEYEKVKDPLPSLSDIDPGFAYAILKEKVDENIIIIIMKTLIRKEFFRLRLDPNDPTLLITKKGKKAIFERKSSELLDYELEFLLAVAKLSPDGTKIPIRSILTHLHLFEGILYDIKQVALKEKIYYADPEKITAYYMRYLYLIAMPFSIFSLGSLIFYIAGGGPILFSTFLSIAIAYKIISSLSHVTKKGVMFKMKIEHELNNLKVRYVKLVKYNDLRGLICFLCNYLDWLFLVPHLSIESVTISMYNRYLAKVKKTKATRVNKKACKHVTFPLEPKATMLSDQELLKIVYCLHETFHQIRLLRMVEQEEDIEFQQLKIQRIGVNEEKSY